MLQRKFLSMLVTLIIIATIIIPITTVSAAFPDGGTYKVTIKNVTADSIYNNNYLATYAIDGNPATRWASNEATGSKKWLLLELDGYHNVVGLRFKDYTGNNVPYKIDAQYAYDDITDHWGNLCISLNLTGDFGATWRSTPDLRYASVPVRTNKILLKQWGTSSFSNTMSVVEVEVYATNQSAYTDLLSAIKLPQQPTTAATVFDIYHRTVHPLMRNDLQPGFIKTDIEPHYTGCYFSVDVVTETRALADMSSIGLEHMKNTLRLIKNHMGPSGEVWDGINEDGSTWEKETLTSIDGTRTLRPMQYCGELEFIKLVYWVATMERDNSFLNEMIQPCRNAWNYVQATYNSTYGMYKMNSHWFDNILREGYDTTGQAWAYAALRNLAEMETKLGNTSNATNYNGKADSLKASFKTQMVKTDGNIHEYKQSNGTNRNHGHISGDTLPMAIYSGILSDTDRSAAYNWLNQYASGLYQYPGMTHGRYIPGWTTDVPTDYQNDELMRGYSGNGEAPESWKCTISNPSAYWAVCKAFGAMGNGLELAKITGYMNTLYYRSFNSCSQPNAADTKYFYERYDCGWPRSDSNASDMGPDSEWRYSRYGTDYINIVIHDLLGIERTLVPDGISIKPCVPDTWYDFTGFWNYQLPD
jgi:hypothetical protein